VNRTFEQGAIGHERALRIFRRLVRSTDIHILILYSKTEQLHWCVAENEAVEERIWDVLVHLPIIAHPYTCCEGALA
jgi:hypothetical protein